MSTVNTTVDAATEGMYPEQTSRQFLMDNIIGPGVKEFRIKDTDTGEVIAKTVVGDGTKLDIEHLAGGEYVIQWVDESENKFKFTYNADPGVWIRWQSIRAQGGYCFSYIYDLAQYAGWTNPNEAPPEPVECPTCGQVVE